MINPHWIAGDICAGWEEVDSRVQGVEISNNAYDTVGDHFYGLLNLGPVFGIVRQQIREGLE